MTNLLRWNPHWAIFAGAGIFLGLVIALVVYAVLYEYRTRHGIADKADSAPSKPKDLSREEMIAFLVGVGFKPEDAPAIVDRWKSKHERSLR